MPQKILVIFAHPVYEKSKASRVLLDHLPESPNITLHDLYELYPTYDIEVDVEKELLESHDVIIWQHPFYWYSCPPILKQWIDLVLEFGWAYGKGGTALKGKTVVQAVTTGGSREAYCRDGRNCFEVREFLAPFEQTAKLCHMDYLPPFVMHGTHKLTEKEHQLYGQQYAQLINWLMEGRHLTHRPQDKLYLNEWLTQIQSYE